MGSYLGYGSVPVALGLLPISLTIAMRTMRRTWHGPGESAALRRIGLLFLLQGFLVGGAGGYAGSGLLIAATVGQSWSGLCSCGWHHGYLDFDKSWSSD